MRLPEDSPRNNVRISEKHRAHQQLSRFGGKATRSSGVVRVLSDEVSRGGGQGPRWRCPPVRSKVSRFRGERVRRRTVALRLSPTLAPPLPVKKTDVRVARLRLTTVRLTAKPVLEPNQGVLVKTELREPQSSVPEGNRARAAAAGLWGA